MVVRAPIAAFVIAALAAAAPPSALAGEPPRPVRVGVRPVRPEALAAELRQRLERAIASGLAAAGADVLPTAATPGTSQVVDYWVQGSYEIDGSTYRLHLELIDAGSGAVIATQDDSCEICTESDAVQAADIAASALKAALGRGAPAPRPPLVSPPLQPPLPPPEPPPAGSAGGGGAAASAPSRPAWRRALPYVAMVAGAAFVVAGAYYLSLDGEGDCAARDESCFRLYDTKGQGLLWIGAGAAAGAAGVALLLLPPAPPAAPGSAAFIPTGVAFRKSF